MQAGTMGAGIALQDAPSSGVWGICLPLRSSESRVRLSSTDGSELWGLAQQWWHWGWCDKHPEG